MICGMLVPAVIGFSEEPEKSLCLLNVGQKRHQRVLGDATTHHLEVSNTEFNTIEGISLNVSLHRDWLLEYAGFERTMNNSLEAVERLADEQDGTAQNCEQRLQDSKVRLESLKAETSDFSDKVKLHEKKLIEYKQKLNGEESDFTKLEAKYQKVLKACEQQRTQAANDQNRYAKMQGELKRLVAGVSDKDGMAVLIQMAVAMAVHQTADGWSKDICLSFLGILKRNKDLDLQVPVPPNEDCSTKLESTRKVFTQTLTRVSELEKTAAKRAEIGICEKDAHKARSAAITPMVADRDMIADHIIESTNSLALMRPVFDGLRAHVNDFEEHVKATLSPECDKAAKVKKSLQAMKDLLASLANCPGKDGRAVLLGV